MAERKKDRVRWYIQIAWICMALICIPDGAGAFFQRGIEVKVKTSSGRTKEIPLYSGYYALIIGCSQYSNGWPALPNPTKDAQEVAAVLKKMGWKVDTLLNPDSQKLKTELNKLTAGPGQNSTKAILVWFSGHGHTLEEAGGARLGYLVPVDAPNPEKDLMGFIDRAYSMRQIETVSQLIKSKHVLMAFDSCFSGAVFQMVRGTPSSYITTKVTKPVRQFITAGAENEQVPDRSVFKDVFIQAIEDGYADLNKDSYVTGEELGIYLQEQVVNYSKGAQNPQCGKINNPRLDKGDFIFELAQSDIIIDEPTEAFLSVNANINGAEVFFDETAIGRTPLEKVRVSQGEHTIQVKRQGYEIYRKRLQFEAGRVRNIHALLNPGTPVMARLYVKTEPSDARVRILNITPRFKQGMELSSGEYDLEVSARGHGTYRAMISLADGEDKNLDIRLDPNSSQNTPPVVGSKNKRINAGAASETECDRLAASPYDDFRIPSVKGIEVNQINLPTAKIACKDAVERYPNEPRLLFQYGRVLDNEKNYTEALRWYRKAAEIGNSAATTNIGKLYYKGHGVSQDYAEALKWCRKAADLGNSMAMNNMAWQYACGHGIKKDPEKAARWMESALRAGCDFSRKQMQSNSSAWSSDFRIALQKRLSDAGVYHGRLDGTFINNSEAQKAIDAIFNTGITVSARNKIGPGSELPSGRGWLGVGIQDLTDELAEYYGSNYQEGVLITQVFKGDPAEKFGIKVNDIIIAVDGKKVKTGREMSKIVGNLSVGKKTRIDYIREGKAKTVYVVLANRTDKEEKPAQATQERGDETGLTVRVLTDEIGLTVRDLTLDIASRFGLSIDEVGVLVAQVQNDNRADKAGILVGDIIKEVNHKPVGTVTEYNRIMEKLDTKKEISMLVKRRNQELAAIKIAP